LSTQLSESGCITEVVPTLNKAIDKLTVAPDRYRTILINSELPDGPPELILKFISKDIDVWAMVITAGDDILSFKDAGFTAVFHAPISRRDIDTITYLHKTMP
jgi:hypothetical protein